MRFVDTNVLLYAVSTARGEATKARAAREVLGAADLALSVQVLQEFYVRATRTGRKDRLTHEQAALLVESWLRFPVQETTVALLRSALATKRRHRLSYWDAAVVAAAPLARVRGPPLGRPRPRARLRRREGRRPVPLKRRRIPRDRADVPRDDGRRP